MNMIEVLVLKYTLILHFYEHALLDPLKTRNSPVTPPQQGSEGCIG
jgi:hypothetical protein